MLATPPVYVVAPKLKLAVARIEKVASLSIWEALSKTTHPRAPIDPEKYPSLEKYSHESTVALIADRPDLHRVAFVRNPWDRIASLYWEKVRRHRGDLERSPYFGEISTEATIGEFCEALFDVPPHLTDRHYRPVQFWLRHLSRDVADEVYRFDELADRWAEMQRDFPGLAALPHRHRHGHTRPHYRDLFGILPARMVRRYYAWEISRFRWSF